MKLFIKAGEKVQEYYEKHNFAYSGDQGLDLFFPEDVIVPKKQTIMIDLDIACELRKYNVNTSIQDLFINSGYFIIPRSSIAKTPLRMSNSIGLIDSNYRHNLKVCVDNVSDNDFLVKRGTKLFQIIAPNLEYFDLVLTDTLSLSQRGSGFGSSN